MQKPLHHGAATNCNTSDLCNPPRQHPEKLHLACTVQQRPAAYIGFNPAAVATRFHFAISVLISAACSAGALPTG